MFGKQFIVKKTAALKRAFQTFREVKTHVLVTFSGFRKYTKNKYTNIQIYKEQLINQKTSPVGRVTSRFDKALLVRTKITRLIPSDECEVTPLL